MRPNSSTQQFDPSVKGIPMKAMRICSRLTVTGLLVGALLGMSAGRSSRWAVAQPSFVTLAAGFAPNPTELAGTGGGDRWAVNVVGITNTSTGPCVGYISESPHEEVTLETGFANLEMRVESDLDTTLVITGPGGIWCNDDSGSKNPVIAGAWLPGQYQVWIGAYQAGQVPDYTLYIQDRR
ncbi:MAG: hypothetical protein AAF827_07980 [Cyanobacteria bacterium P01_D01_bin.6]